MFKRGDRVRVIAGEEFETVIERYVDEMTRYGTDEHYAGWYETPDGCIHESSLQAI